MTLTLVLGGTRSGKSAVAEGLASEAAASTGAPVTYVATAQGADAGMRARIEAHRARRPASWTSIEVDAGTALPALLARLRGVVLVDSLGAWVASNHGFAVDALTLAESLGTREGVTIVVSEEVGLSVHPPTVLGRRFVDALGLVNQTVAAVADRAVLVVAGRIVEL